MVLLDFDETITMLKSLSYLKGEKHYIRKLNEQDFKKHVIKLETFLGYTVGLNDFKIISVNYLTHKKYDCRALAHFLLLYRDELPFNSSRLATKVIEKYIDNAPREYEDE